MGDRIAEVLNVVVRNLVSISAQRRELQPGFHRLKGERVDFDGIKKILSALLAREEIVNPGAQRIAAKLPGMAAAIEADGSRQMQAVFPSGAREQVGAADAIDDVRDF